MIIAKVIANVVSTVKHDSYVGEKILMVMPLSPDNKKINNPIVAIDKVQAGIGDKVLVLQEGNSSRQIMGTNNTPVNTIIIGIVDDVNTK